MLCVFEQGASRLENLRVIRCSLFLSECKDLFFSCVTLWKEKNNKLLLPVLVFTAQALRLLPVKNRKKVEIKVPGITLSANSIDIKTLSDVAQLQKRKYVLVRQSFFLQVLVTGIVTNHKLKSFSAYIFPSVNAGRRICIHET